MNTNLSEIWAANPDLTRLYCFEDGNCFASLGDALSHKKTTQTDFEMIEKHPKTKEAETEEKPTENKKKK